MSYLYGAAIQGIQSYILQTNELKDIVGASELVSQICTTMFEKTLGQDFKKENLIIGAAGNVRYIFDDKETCAKVVRNFPRTVLVAAPGITMSQAVVEMDDDFQKVIDELEAKLKCERNRPKASITIGTLGMKRSNKTGLPICKSNVREDEKGIDLATAAKRRHNTVLSLAKKSLYGTESKEEVSPKCFPFDIEKLTGDNDWIAIVHADGNGVGQIAQRIGADLERYKEFSKQLDLATEKAANDAFRSLDVPSDADLPLRPVVLGGDDMTVIIGGRYAIDYTKKFLEQFEHRTSEGSLGRIVKEATGLRGLTACAGVAFVKSSYPFHYGYALAEELCNFAKKDAKAYATPEKGVASCLMFHKVEDSFIQDYLKIKSRVLTTSEGVSHQYGPYYLEHPREGYSTIDELQSLCSTLGNTDDDGVRSGLRRWLSAIHNSVAMADQYLERMLQIYSGKNKPIIKKLCTPSERLTTDQATVVVYQAFDVLSLFSIENTVTK